MRGQEFRLFPLLERQFPELAQSYRSNLAIFSARMDSLPPLLSPRNLQWESDDHGRLFFRTGFEQPSLFLLSYPVSRCTRYKQYKVPIDEERKFFADLALIPAYFSNLNMITCVSLWGGHAAEFRSPYRRQPIGDEKMFWRLDPQAADACMFSSLNIFLRGEANENEVPPSMQAALSDSLRYAFWSHPKGGYSCSAHVIHSRERIYRVLKVAKSIYLVRKIFEPEMMQITPYYRTLVQKVELGGITRWGHSRAFHAFISKDVAQKLSQTRDGQEFLINGMIYEFKERGVQSGRGLNLLSVVEELLPTSMDLFKTLTAFVADERFRSNLSVLADVGSVSEVREDVEDAYKFILKNVAWRVKYTATVFDVVGRDFNEVLDDLFPIVLRDGERVLFVHPLIFSALLQLGLEHIIENRDSGSLAKFVRLIEQLPRGDFARIVSTSEWNSIRGLGPTFKDLKQAITSAAGGIMFAKILHECF